VDVETGNVRVIKVVSVNDCGFPMNALTTESQVIGGMIQGVSWALFENRILDRNVGTMVNPNLEAYKVLMPADMFEAVSILTEVANAGNNMLARMAMMAMTTTNPINVKPRPTRGPAWSGYSNTLETLRRMRH
jgi:CO/xanthine dehydrogenase Mo-binding subunit